MPSTKSRRAAVISGGPGTGKSRLAAECTYDRGGKGFWTDAGSSVSETLAALAPSLDVETGTRSADEIAFDVERALADEAAETLWVIDNLTDLSLVNELLGRAGSVQLLVTTRDARACHTSSSLSEWIIFGQVPEAEHLSRSPSVRPLIGSVRVP